MTIEFIGGPIDGEIKEFPLYHDFITISPGESKVIIGTYWPRVSKAIQETMEPETPIPFDWTPTP